MSYHENVDDLRNCDCYFTHFNTSRPFAVYINKNNKKVYVYKKEEDDYISTYTHFVAYFEPKQVFIGESPLNESTRFCGGHGEIFDGNSILLKMDKNSYVFIGNMIFSFKSKHEIVIFVSPIGNNNIPYPYAIDNEKNYYFLLGMNCGVLKATNDGDPYDYYYTVLRHIGESEKIDCIYIGQERFSIITSANPAQDYEKLLQHNRGPIYIKFKGEEERMISKAEYIRILDDYNEKVGLTALDDFKLLVK